MCSEHSTYRLVTVRWIGRLDFQMERNLCFRWKQKNVAGLDRFYMIMTPTVRHLQNCLRDWVLLGIAWLLARIKARDVSRAAPCYERHKMFLVEAEVKKVWRGRTLRISQAFAEFQAGALRACCSYALRVFNKFWKLGKLWLWYVLWCLQSKVPSHHRLDGRTRLELYLRNRILTLIPGLSQG
jgi:hypothetical protein